jgi:hypothetical protein
MDRGGKGLRFAWGRYLECTAALEKAKNISAAGNWPIDIPRYCDEHVIEVFIGKSAWHGNYAKNFDIAYHNFKELKQWLEATQTTQDENEDLWGVNKAEYTFNDLRELLEKEGLIPPEKPKGSSRRSPSRRRSPAHRKSPPHRRSDSRRRSASPGGKSQGKQRAQESQRRR